MEDPAEHKSESAVQQSIATSLQWQKKWKHIPNFLLLQIKITHTKKTIFSVFLVDWTEFITSSGAGNVPELITKFSDFASPAIFWSDLSEIKERDKKLDALAEYVEKKLLRNRILCHFESVFAPKEENELHEENKEAQGIEDNGGHCENSKVKEFFFF